MPKARSTSTSSNRRPANRPAPNPGAGRLILCTALRWRLHRAALAIAPRCVGDCSALRWRLQCAALAIAVRCIEYPSSCGREMRWLKAMNPPPWGVGQGLLLGAAWRLWGTFSVRHIEKISCLLAGMDYLAYLCTRNRNGSRSNFRCAYMVTIVQLVRASDCGSECRGFESH